MKQTQYGKYTYNSSSIIRRYTHKLRLKKSLKVLNLKKSDKVLDYGAGDGYFATLLKKRHLKEISCYEPVNEQFEQMKFVLSDFSDIDLIKNINSIKDQSFNKVFCLEVLEHLPEERLTKSLKEIYDLLNANGEALLTVPRESGFNGFVKNSIKKTIDKNKKYTYKELWDISFNKKKVDRIVMHKDTMPYIYEHFGFNNIQLEKSLIESKFKIQKKISFPFKYLSLFSSQIFYIVTK